uniref:Uncharacterized protein n=1 Tax=Chrysotila carterae TaxID=13221 RepID=A0A7S4FBM2_CHRCT
MERIVYPAVREMDWQRLPVSPDSYGSALEQDRRAWNGATAFTQYKNDRSLLTVTKPASATDYYDTNSGKCTEISRASERSPMRYSGMRETAAARNECRPNSSTNELVGPGSYSPTNKQKWEPRLVQGEQIPLPVFADAQPRTRSADFMHACSSGTPGYSSLVHDQRNWQRHDNNRQKGAYIPRERRFQKPAGSPTRAYSGSPGPGSYGKIASWPTQGYIGTARGFNHNR